ncbi:MAG: ABC transporter ATP-binding protein, partial [Candidatus Zixiibacteriota bacterium]
MVRVFKKRKKLNYELPHFKKVKPGEIVIEMRGITKHFPGVVANDHINFDVRAGEIHALLGENGAGKTTLMNILYGLHQPDEGEIYIRGKRVSIRSPKDALNLGIGMVHQHFMLVQPLSVTENIILGLKSPKEPFLDLDVAEKNISELSEKYGLKVDPKAKIWQLSVGEKQRVEILKALYRGAQILILDEPTSVLTPPEIKELMAILKGIAKEGLAVVPFITHKLPEVMAVSDRVTVLRAGKVVAKIETKRTNKEELAEKMVGRRVIFRLQRSQVKKGEVILEVKDLQALDDKGLPALKKVSFSLRKGEILGVAGVAGNGQRELTEVITGLRRATGGKVLIFGRDMTNRSPAEVIEAGVGHIPEDRIGMGLVMDFSVAENLILQTYRKSPFAYNWFFPFRKNWFLDYEEIDKYAEKLMSDFNVVAPGTGTPARHLSGGNLQRLILAREISRNPKLLIAAQPTRGLDVGATEYIRQILMAQKIRGMAILL